MLARREIPVHFQHWNLVHGAPNGHERRRRDLVKWLYSKERWLRLRGPFSVQGNNTIRAFEYPWAWYVTPLQAGMRVLEIGGGLCGFQFALSGAGLNVTNVDPGMESLRWPVNHRTFKQLNNVFGTKVELRNCTTRDALLESEGYDRAFSLSVLEHLPEEEIHSIVTEVYKALKPGGFFIVTVDLFLNLKPFTSREENEYGLNQNVRWMTTLAPFELVHGNEEELYGFSKFCGARILRKIEQYFIGAYPALAQCFVLRKPSV